MIITNKIADKPNIFYILSVTTLTFILPIIGFLVEHLAVDKSLSINLFYDSYMKSIYSN